MASEIYVCCKCAQSRTIPGCVKCGNSSSNVYKIKTIREQNQHRTINQDFLDVFQSETLSDITVQSSDNHDIRAHRVVLSARSPVFRVMLHSDIEEAKTGIVLSQFESKILNPFIEFLYSNQITDNKDCQLLCSLPEVAEYYQVNSLMSQCELLLLELLDHANCLNLFVVSYRYKMNILKLKVTNYIRESKDKFEIVLKAFDQIDNVMVKNLFENVYKFTSQSAPTGSQGLFGSRNSYGQNIFN